MLYYCRLKSHVCNVGFFSCILKLSGINNGISNICPDKEAANNLNSLEWAKQPFCRRMNLFLVRSQINISRILSVIVCLGRVNKSSERPKPLYLCKYWLHITSIDQSENVYQLWFVQIERNQQNASMFPLLQNKCTARFNLPVQYESLWDAISIMSSRFALH